MVLGGENRKIRLLGLVDFEKAFDTVEHSGLWSSPLERAFEDNYVEMPKSLYEGQVGTVKALSKQRGVKQGGPISGAYTKKKRTTTDWS